MQNQDDLSTSMLALGHMVNEILVGHSVLTKCLND